MLKPNTKKIPRKMCLSPTYGTVRDNTGSGLL